MTTSAQIPQDLPKDAAHRLEELEHGLFTSDLSVNEFLLVKEAGFHPLGLRHGLVDLPHRHPDPEVGREPGADQADRGHVQRPGAGHEPDGGGGRGARRRRRRRGAPRRQLLRVGQRLGRVHRLRHRGQGRGRHSYRNALGKPFTSDLSGQDFWTLMQTGHVPQGLVMGTCVFHIAHRKLDPGARVHGAERRAAQLHPGALRGPGAGHDPHAGRGRPAQRQRHRRRPAGGEVAPVGLAHHRVPVARHGGDQDAAGEVTLPKPTTIISLDN